MRKLLGWFSLRTSVIIVLLICGEIMLCYPCNHGSGFNHFLYPVCGLIILSGFYGFFLKESKLAILFFLLGFGLSARVVVDASHTSITENE